MKPLTTFLETAKSGLPESICSCHYGIDCKHGVAVVIEYPCRMDDTDISQIQKNRQGPKPFQIRIPFFWIFLELIHRLLVLISIFLSMWSQISIFVRRVITKGIVFVIAHHGQGRIIILHGFDDFQGLSDFRTAINKIPHEYGFSIRFRMFIKSIIFYVAYFFQQLS